MLLLQVAVAAGKVWAEAQDRAIYYSQPGSSRGAHDLKAYEAPVHVVSDDESQL